MSVLERRPNDFASRNLLLHALLGLHAWGARLDRWTEAPGSTVLPDDDQVVLAVLGALAFTRSVDAVLERALEAPMPVDLDAPAEAQTPLRGSLLR